MPIGKDPTLHLFNPAPYAALAALGAALTLSLTHPATSKADPFGEGAYVHRSCVTADDTVDASGGWKAFSTLADSGVFSHPTCGASSGARLQSDMFPTGPVSPGEGTGWTYTAPSGTSITGISASYAGLSDPAASGGHGVIQLINKAGGIFLNFNGSVSESSARSITWSGLDTQAVTWRIICDQTGPACAGSVGWSALYEPHLLLADRTPPVGGATSGSLTTNLKVAGFEHLTYSASDSGGGLARLRLYVDGVLSEVDHVVDELGGRCRPSGLENGAWVFSRPRPCPLTVAADETLDTTQIADGKHILTYKVVDAAQHETTLWSDERLVANHPPVNEQVSAFRDNSVYANPLVGSAIEALDDGTWTGPSLHIARAWAQCDANGALASCATIPAATGLEYTPTAADVGHRLRLLVTATNPADTVMAATAPSGVVARPSSGSGGDATPPTKNTTTPTPGDDSPAPAAPAPPLLPVVPPPAAAGHELRGKVVGDTGCPQDKATLRFEHVAGGKVKLGYGKAAAVQLQLTCTNNGKPIQAAHLDVFTRVGAGAAVASDVATDDAGHATIRLAAGAGRSISVGYRMYDDDPIARATATLKVAVNGRVRLRGNHRTLRNGRALTLRGRLLGGHVPRRGVTLTVQWRDHHRWRPFAQIKTNRKGTFSYAYRFTRSTRRITYALRVQVSKGQLDYPFQPVASNAVRVTVGP
ncbi:MAG TPA: hypothetical protein VFG42_12690 [Baekduia sp.]|uniref:hypothetical protein n=1 Tax=Baekduia sp. TaxID=2600305 RepID=UPI002D77C611|nr:hypothetical protein [Baekduia sp.]HET6507639.1 hypothetical protein [Baekduia sp.]